MRTHCTKPPSAFLAHCAARCIPIAIEDNIQTTDVPTTGGALAFAGFTPVPYGQDS